MTDLDLACDRITQARRNAAAGVMTWREYTGDPAAVGEAVRSDLVALAEECLQAVALWDLKVRGGKR